MARRLRSPSNAELMSNDDPEVVERRRMEREETARQELQNLIFPSIGAADSSRSEGEEHGR